MTPVGVETTAPPMLPHKFQKIRPAPAVAVPLRNGFPSADATLIVSFDFSRTPRCTSSIFASAVAVGRDVARRGRVGEQRALRRVHLRQTLGALAKSSLCQMPGRAGTCPAKERGLAADAARPLETWWSQAGSNRRPLQY